MEEVLSSLQARMHTSAAAPDGSTGLDCANGAIPFIHLHNILISGVAAGPLPLEGVTMQSLVSVLMGSKSDWEGVMVHAAEMLDKLGVPCEVRVLSAHRTPDALFTYIA